jgi:transcriptional regulator with XRE-family HTH domain
MVSGQRAEANYYGRLLLRELVKLRQQNRLGQAEVGAKMKYTKSKMSRIEKGQVPDWHNLSALLDIYGVPLNEYDWWERMWELSRVRGWWREFGIGNHGYIALEHEALVVREYQMASLPGLLQTPGYIRRLVDGGSKPRSRSHIEKLVEIRKRRQTRLTSENPLTYQALLNEPVVRHGCDHAQLLRLIEVAELPNTTVQIVPLSGELHDGTYGSFTIFSFEDKDEPDVAYVEHRLGMAQTDEEEVVKAVSLSFRNILKHALSPEASIALIRDLMT